MPSPSYQSPIPTKTLSFYFPGTSHLALRAIKELFSTEKEACARAKEIAEILTANKNKLKNKFKDIDEVIKLYRNLSINSFDISTDFFKTNRLNDNKNTVEDWIRSIYEVVGSEECQTRLKLLKDATIKYSLWNKIVADIIDSDMLPGEARQVLKQSFSIPIYRVLRLKLLFVEIRKQYAGDKKETIEQMEHLINVFTALADYLDACVGNSKAKEQSPRDSKRRYAQQIPANLVRYCQETENSVNNDAFLRFLEEHAKKNSLTLPIILNELKKITSDPKEQLIKLERAFGGIRIMPATADQKREAAHLFRKDFLYTDAQLKQIALLKTVYLAIVANTPRVENSPFEQYLETEYPKTATAEHGGLLAFNTTCVSWFVKTKEKTTSMKTLEALKAGIGRIKPPDHQRDITAKIAGYGRVFSVGFSY